MSFTTLEFGLFMPIVFVLYWFVFNRSFRIQNRLLLAASYVFYGWWDWRFLGLIFLTTVLSYSCALAKDHRKVWTTLSVAANLLILCFFKYFHFFGENLQRLFSVFGVALDWYTIEILLPVGISFYTFQAIGYSVDVYRGRTEAVRQFDTFALYIAFFPQLVAGPIERSTKLLPQFMRPRKWNYDIAVLGLRQILWGLFKKCAMADGVAHFVDVAYRNHAGGDDFQSALWCLIGVVGFSLQVYGDFSGYCDIAKGTGRLLGIELMDNFLFPYFSRNAMEFWRRWHRALNEWFKEYVYFPLGGSRRGNRYVNAMIVFLLSGLWHGASWTFVVWGAVSGVWYLTTLACGARKYKPGTDAPASRADAVGMFLTFWIYSLIRVFFRSEDLAEALSMYSTVLPIAAAAGAVLLAGAFIVARTHFSIYYIVGICAVAACLGAALYPVAVIPYLAGGLGFVWSAVVLWAEWRGRDGSFALETMPSGRLTRMAIYAGLYVVVFTCVIDGSDNFIYFKF